MVADVHAITEIFDAVDSACDAINAAAADGKLTLLDARFLLTPVRESIIAIKDRGLVRDELKGLDESAMVALVDRMVVTAEKLTQAVAELSAIA